MSRSPDRKITEEICATVAQVARGRAQACAFLTETSIVDRIVETLAQNERGRADWLKSFVDKG